MTAAEAARYAAKRGGMTRSCGHHRMAWAIGTRGVDAVLSGGIGAGGHDASRFGASPNSKGGADQGWITLLLHRAEERIQVQMHDGPWHHRGPH